MVTAHPYRGLSKRLSVLADIGRIWTAFEEVPKADKEDPTPIGFRRILEARTVRDLLGEPGIVNRVPHETEEFLKNFSGYALGTDDGYILSLVDGRLPLRKILMISTLGRFKTLLGLARLRNLGVIVFGEEVDPDATFSRRRA